MPSQHDTAAREALREQPVSDTLPDEVLDRLVGLAIQLFSTSFALVTLTDGSRSWCGSRDRAAAGYAPQLQLAARSFADLAKGDEPAVVMDASADARLREHPLVTGAPALRFVAAAPLVTAAGRCLGAFCILDSEPRRIGTRGLELLQGLAACACAEVEQREVLARTREALDTPLSALGELTRSTLLTQPDADLNIRQILETVGRSLRVQRTSLWRLGRDGGGLVCEQQYDALQGQYTSRTELARAVAPAYFAALETNEVLAADDALRDQRTRELAPGYLEPLGIASMLDAPVFVSGRLSGVLCCEHVGPARRWTQGERNLVVAAANLYALNVARHLRERSEARLRSILQCEPDCVMVVAPDRRLLEINPAGLRLLGAPDQAAVRGEPVAQFIHSLDRQAYLDLHERVLRGESGGAAFRAVSLDGTQRWVEAHSTPLRESDGSVEAVLSVTRDVTERLASQHALAERIKELRCLYQVLELTSDDSCSVAEICHGIAELLPPSMLHAQSAVARVVVGEEEYRSPGWSPPLHAMQRAVRAIGAEVGHVEIGYPDDVPDPDGAHDLFLAEEIELLEAVAKHVSRMLNDRRRGEILLHSERQRAIGQLIGGIAHDFNNLLQVMTGTTDELVAALADDETLGPLARMGRTAARRGAELTSRLLAFSGQQVLDPRSVDIAKLVEDLKALLRRTLGEQVEVSVETPEELWPAMVDARQLETALLNLCLNARDAMPAGGMLDIALANAIVDRDAAGVDEQVTPGEYVSLAVSDTGCGMSPEVAARAVDPFFTTKDVGRGSGLGLSMVYGFARQSNGHLRIDSEPGRGTTVTLYFPRALAEADRAAEPMPETRRAGGPAGILVVEDDELVRQHVVVQLSSMGYRVEAAANGETALKMLAERTDIDLLFSDIVMPGGMNGWQLANTARALHPGLSILLTSGYADSAAALSGQPERGMMLLKKPYRRRDLAEKVRAALLERPTAET